MFGIVLAIVNMSACSETPSAATSRVERTKPLSRDTTVPAAITALEARIRSSSRRGHVVVSTGSAASAVSAGSS